MVFQNKQKTGSSNFVGSALPRGNLDFPYPYVSSGCHGIHDWEALRNSLQVYLQATLCCLWTELLLSILAYGVAFLDVID